MKQRIKSAKAVGGMQVVRLSSGRLQEAFVTIPAIGFEEPASLFQRLYDFIAENPAMRIVRQDVFGLVQAVGAEGDREKAYRLGGRDWPMTWVEEGNGGGSPVAGIQVHGVQGVEVQPVRFGGRTVGAVFEDDLARHCVLGGLTPAAPNAPRGDQARETLDLMERVLDSVGLDFSQVYRTWFYLDDILDWYDEFNDVRNRFFTDRKLYEGVVPASTGIGGSNASGAAVIADLLAVVPKDPQYTLRAIPSPLQCPALEYGSSFSRAVEIDLPGQRRVYVSGTASIAPEGETLHVGDAAKQVATTMEVVQAILNSRQMGWEHVTRAIGYFKHGEDAPLFSAYCRERRLPDLPAVISKNDVCRDELLFEVEVDAVMRCQKR